VIYIARLQLLQRFSAKVRISDNGCWEWTGCRNRRGYGVISVNRKLVRAHRLLYQLCVDVPAGKKHIHHLCGNPACVKPHHLVAVSPEDHASQLTTTSRGYINARSTHCVNGHPFNEENTFVSQNRGRVCKECRRRRAYEFYWRNKDKTLEKEVIIHYERTTFTTAHKADTGTQ